jgi:uncharacterized YigZ family protein
MPQTLSCAAENELVIKKSRFIGCVQPVADRRAAQAVVAALRDRHPDANHVCWALVAGGQSAAVDDGEPSGTAGRPMLNVLLHQDLDGVLATVVRYFGGVKLGAGGLVRAYTDCVAQALKGALRVPIVATRILHCQAPYALEGLIRRRIEAAGGALLDVGHGAQVEFVFELAEDHANRLVADLDDAGRGQVVWRVSPGRGLPE